MFGLSFRVLGIDADCSHFSFSPFISDLANKKEDLKWPNVEKIKRKLSTFESVYKCKIILNLKKRSKFSMAPNHSMKRQRVCISFAFLRRSQIYISVNLRRLQSDIPLVIHVQILCEGNMTH